MVRAVLIFWELRYPLFGSHFPHLQIAPAQRLLVWPRSMAIETNPKDRESKIAPVQVIPLQQVYPMQKVYPMQPVVLVPLNPPENDYLFLSIASFFFFILLAIPALLFSFKVGTIQLPPTPVAPRSAFSVPPYLPAPA